MYFFELNLSTKTIIFQLIYSFFTVKLQKRTVKVDEIYSFVDNSIFRRELVKS